MGNTGGEPLNWDEAIRAHNHRVLLSLLALGVPYDLAEDLAHAAWLRLIERYEAGKLREVKLPGLVIVQARFLALNALDKRNKEQNRSVVAEDLWSPLAAAGPNPEDRLLARESLEQAIAVLEDCSDSARAVFRQIYEDPPPTHKVVAARVGLSVQRVRQILCEVRKKMRRAMESKI